MLFECAKLHVFLGGGTAYLNVMQNYGEMMFACQFSERMPPNNFTKKPIKVV